MSLFDWGDVQERARSQRAPAEIFDFWQEFRSRRSLWWRLDFLRQRQRRELGEPHGTAPSASVIELRRQA